MTFIDSDLLKRTLIRFLKDNGVYSFIVKEIKREYNHDLNFFIETLSNSRSGVRGVFNLRTILSFPWEGDTLDENEREKNIKFWRVIDKKWRDICDGMYDFNKF